MNYGEQLQDVEVFDYSAGSIFSDIDDDMYQLQALNDCAIFSHDTALFLHDLSDRPPFRYTVTVPCGCDANTLRNLGVKVFTVDIPKYEIGITTAQTFMGNNIKVYDMERAVCECINPESKIDISIYTDAVKRYVLLKNRNITKLMRYAEIFGVEKKVRTYLEVLL